MRWERHDGGRAAAGLAVSMAAAGHRRSARDGVPRDVYEPLLRTLGFEWTATMRIGSGCTVHLDADELPGGPLVVRLSRHLAAVIDGVVYDTYDPRRGGSRCVYGYYSRAPIGATVHADVTTVPPGK